MTPSHDPTGSLAQAQENGGRRRAALLVLALLYWVALRTSYVWLVAPVFYHMNFRYRPVPPWATGLSLAMALLPAAWLPIRARRPSQLVVWMLYILVLVPVTLVPLFALRVSYLDSLAPAAMILLSLHALAISTRLPLIQFPRLYVTPALFWIGIGVLCAALYADVIGVFGLRVHLPTLAEVYTTRSAYKEQAAAAGPGVIYAVLWLGRALNPLLIATGFTTRHRSLAVLGIAGQVLLFAVTGMKTVFLSGVFLFVLLWPLRNRGRSFGLWIVAGATIVVVVCAMADGVIATPIFTNVIVRRMMFTPGLLSGLFYDYYSKHQPTQLLYSFLRIFNGGVSPTPPAFVVGNLYFGNPEMSANTNMFADAYANFRFGGMLAMTVAAVVALWIYDSVADGRPYQLVMLLIGLSADALCDTALPTVLVTHGLLLVTVVVYLMPEFGVSFSSERVVRNRLADRRPSTELDLNPNS